MFMSIVNDLFRPGAFQHRRRHFRQASRLLPEPAIVGNIAYAVKLSSPLGIKGKDLDDLNDLGGRLRAILVTRALGTLRDPR